MDAEFMEADLTEVDDSAEHMRVAKTVKFTVQMLPEDLWGYVSTI